MKNLIFALAGLTAIAAAAPAMAQAGPAAYEPPIAVPSPAVNAADGLWQLLQGYGKDGEVTFTWYYVTPSDFSRYHGS